jgi:cytochrome c oxidase assembly protein subunit 15
MSTQKNNSWLHAYAVFLACATFLLIVAGALVTSNDAGLSVPDWPTSFGTFRMPRMVGGVLYEHGHRMIAATVGLMTVILAVWMWLKEPRRWLRWVSGIAVLAVIAQGVLGGITVLFYLPVVVSVGHATLAQSVFCATVSLSLFARPDWRWDEAKMEDLSAPSLRQLSVVTSAAILLQLVLGAAFRHNGIGIVPHIVVALVVTLLVTWTAMRVFTKFSSERRLVRSAGALVGLLLVQLFLGVGAYMMKIAAQNAPQPLPPVVNVTTAHVAVGALVLAASVVLALQVFRLVASPCRAPALGEASEKAAV